MISYLRTLSPNPINFSVLNGYITALEPLVTIFRGKNWMHSLSVLENLRGLCVTVSVSRSLCHGLCVTVSVSRSLCHGICVTVSVLRSLCFGVLSCVIV